MIIAGFLGAFGMVLFMALLRFVITPMLRSDGLQDWIQEVKDEVRERDGG
jgi:hypothetical protein